MVMKNKLTLLIGTIILLQATVAFGQTLKPKILQETYGSWTVNCQQYQKDNKPKQLCQMFQEQRQTDNNQRLFTISIVPTSEEHGMEATLIAPFGLLLQAGVSIRIKGDEIVSGTFRTCLPVGCIIKIPFDATLKKAFSIADRATIAMVSDGDETFELDLPLDGFSSATKRLMYLHNQN